MPPAATTFPTQFVQDAFQRGLDRRSAVVPLSQIRRVTGKRVQYTEYVGRPTAAFVAEGADKAATGAEYAQVTLNVKKIASIVMYTEELIEDAQGDPTVLVNQDVRAAFSDLIDSHALGQTSAGTLTTQFDAALRNTTQTVEYAQANQDALAKALSSAITTVERTATRRTGSSCRTTPAACCATRATRPAGRCTSGSTRPGSTTGRTPRRSTGSRSISTNLQTITGTAAAGRVVGIVGDFSHAVFAIRDDIRVKFSDQATVHVSGTDHRLWQENKVASLWETRVGFTVHDLNRAFVAIVNAA
jgi:hypothetical protein